MERPRIIPVDPNSPADAAIQEALDWLAKGEPVVLPTETVYGLACRPDLPGALERVFMIKQRPEAKPLPRMVSSAEDVQLHVSEWSDGAAKLAERFWPGPLTLILPTATGDISFCVPNHPVLLALLKRSPVPLAMTSANHSGEEDSITARAAANVLGSAVPLILDGGPAQASHHNTIVDCSADTPTLIHTGVISQEDIQSACPEVVAE